MKALISILICLALFYTAKKLYFSYQKIEKQQASHEEGAPAHPAQPAASVLPGLPAYLEASLAAAEKQGPAELRDWLTKYRAYARDPRLASIELDYVVLISHQDPAEARRIFKDVQGRTPTFSPIYERVKRLEKTFQ